MSEQGCPVLLIINAADTMNCDVNRILNWTKIEEQLSHTRKQMCEITSFSNSLGSFQSHILHDSIEL